MIIRHVFVFILDFILVAVVISSLNSCNSDDSITSYIQNPNPQNMLIFTGDATDDERYVYYTGYESDNDKASTVYVIDKEENKVVSTGMKGNCLILKDSYLYFYQTGIKYLYRIATDNLIANIESRDYNIEVVPLTSTFPVCYIIYGDRICYNPRYGDIISTDIDGGEEEHYNNEFVCGYENGVYYYIKTPQAEDSSAECVIVSKKSNKKYDLCNLAYINGRYKEYNDFLFVYNGYAYYTYDNFIYRNKLEKGAGAEVIYDRYDDYNNDTYHGYFLGVTPSGVYVRDSYNNINCISPDDKSVKQCVQKYDGTNIYFLSNVDNELYYIFEDVIFKVE